MFANTQTKIWPNLNHEKRACLCMSALQLHSYRNFGNLFVFYGQGQYLLRQKSVCLGWNVSRWNSTRVRHTQKPQLWEDHQNSNFKTTAKRRHLKAFNSISLNVILSIILTIPILLRIIFKGQSLTKPHTVCGFIYYSFQLWTALIEWAGTLLCDTE